ncbi:related to aldehyde-alcohol dehydrogenase [Phialocephala subalpina]|uniref:Related to aldehyde-alcohol dehydrogenase n=1 Tax=Phialocephala subalpina TaxID=576137 RepID=A0A1L7X5S7_9HELO|nr:related to aldehyde-alcohol dehydrogenase [Phialocephala subalpina]
MAAKGESYYPAFPPSIKPHISSGLSFPEACAHHVTNTFHSSKVYIIVSNSISKTENFTRLQDALGHKIVGVRKGIKPHTPWDDIVEIALANNVSSLDDLAKLTPEAKTKGLKAPQLPVINIPTSLSGGEYSTIAGGTDTRSNHKALFTHSDMGADLIILDPSLSISTPERIWLSTGIRAVDHCVEGLCSLFKSDPEADKGFAKGLELLVPSLLITKNDWNNEDARLKEMLGVVESMKGMSVGIPMGGSHGIGHQLGPLGVGHGETSCIMLPAILKYNFKYGDEEVQKPQQKVLKLLWAEAPVAELLKKRGLTKEKSDAGDVVGAVISELGMPRTLKDIGVGRDKLDALAENCLKDPWLKTNPVPLTKKEQVLEVLEMVVGDEKSNL